VAQLARAVTAPACGAAGGCQGACVSFAGAEGGHPAAEPAHAHGCGAVRGRAAAELAVGVAAPALDRASGRQATSVVFAGTEGGDAAPEPAHVHRYRAVRGRAVAQLAEE